MSKKKKVKRPSFRTQREGVAFRRHDLARLRTEAEKAAKALQKREPDGDKKLLENREELAGLIADLIKAPEWSNVRLDPGVIANYLAQNKLREKGGEKAMAEYIGACLDQIINDKARMGLTVIALSALCKLVARNEDRLAWTNLIMLNLLTNQEVKPRSVPILHHLFWLNYADYVFQRNVMSFVSRVLDPDLLQTETFCTVLAQDWEKEEIEVGGLAEGLGLKVEKTVTKVAETTRLPTLVAEPFEGFIPGEEVVEQALEVISSQSVDIIRAALDNKAGKEEIESAAAGLVRQVTAAAYRSFQAGGYLDELERTLSEVAESERGTLPRELAHRAKTVLGLLPVRFNPLFDAILILGVRRKAALEYHQSKAKEAEPKTVPQKDGDGNKTSLPA